VGWFDKLLGRKAIDPRSVSLASDADKIKVFDAYGREMFMSKDDWRKRVLPGTIKANWDDPDKLYGIIVGSLEDGFFADVLAAAKRLYQIDPTPARAANVYGIALLKTNRLDEAEQVFRSQIENHGEEGFILSNLAKVFAARGDDKEAERILWHALEVDPNQENGLGWYLAIHRERGGETVEQGALRRVAVLPGSWRAQLWLARQALQNGNLEAALASYRACLARVTKPVPADVLMQMSGDLGNAGNLRELLQLVEPCFSAPVHGLTVGNNLIKAHVDLGQFEDAHRILDQLHAVNRPDYKQTLSSWDTEIAKAKLASAPADQEVPLEATIITVEGPAWLAPSSPAAGLFPTKSPNVLSIALLGSSAEPETYSLGVRHEMTHAPGRMSRALPLFLAEQIHFYTRASATTMIPWIVGPPGSFVVSSVRWNDEYAVKYAQHGRTKSDYVVTSYLRSRSEPWTFELRVIRCSDGKCFGDLSASFPSNQPQAAIPNLAQRLLSLLAQQAVLETPMAPPNYKLPASDSLPNYLLRLEQLLAVRCSNMDGVQSDFLSGEREILDGNLQLCLDCPDNIITRILLAQTLQSMKRVRPSIVQEFKDRILLLLEEKPLAEPAQATLHGWIQDVFSP
jgi:tetratricopeptide (TPR) repeat protein